MLQAKLSSDLLNNWIEPIYNRPFAQLIANKTMVVDSTSGGLKLEYPFHTDEMKKTILTSMSAFLKREVSQSEIEFSAAVKAHSVQQHLKPLHGIKNIIVIASGKGGVGKSTTAVNLSLALSREGAKVGLLDADIYGPSIPTMLGLVGKRPEATEDKKFIPLEAFGVKTHSIGFLIGDDQPVVWRGPMVTQMLDQLLTQTLWGELDYLIVDMPPGTGDTQLTLSQRVPIAGAVIVTTPQDIALLDAKKGLQMFKKVNVKILGIIENMAAFICPKCGEESAIFGTDGGRDMAKKYATHLLGSLPLTTSIREYTDSGRPTVIAEPDGTIARAYQSAAAQMMVGLSESQRDYKSLFPNIVVENT